MQKKIFWLFTIILTQISCSTPEKTDEYLLQKDKENLQESLKSLDVNLYKYIKISSRVAWGTDSISDQFQGFQEHQEIFEKNSKLLENSDELDMLDYISMYRDYHKVSDYVEKTDEDIFPLLVGYKDSITQETISFSKEQRDSINTSMHALLSGIFFVTKSFGRNICLYECYETDTHLLQDSEFKSFLQFFRGLIFFQKGLNYMADQEYTQNINWINANPDTKYFIGRFVFRAWNVSDERMHIAYHAMNHAMRGMNRLMMDREIDKQRAIEDFEAFLEDAKTLGINNELVWAIETYVYLNQGKKEKAIASMKKLKNSDIFSEKDKELMDESIQYVKDRDDKALMNGVYDKIFLGKIASKYVVHQLSQVDWRKLAKEYDVKGTEELFNTLDKINVVTENIQQYTGTEQLDKVKEKGSELLDKLTDF